MNKNSITAYSVIGTLTNVGSVLAIESRSMESLELAQLKSHKIPSINSYSAGNYANSNGDNSIVIGLSSNSCSDGLLPLGGNPVARERSSVALDTDLLENKQYDNKNIRDYFG
ncbi:MAG: hypothetical protein ACTS85_03645 [Arsenophonus sp. NC-PG7-MAG3]